MVKPFYHEQSVGLDGEQYRLVINFATIDAAETQLAPLTFDMIVGQLLDGTAPMAMQTRVVWGLLREHHPELTIDQAATFVAGPTGEAIGIALGNLILAAFPLTEPSKDGGKNPRKPRGASRNSSSNGRRPG